MEKIQGVETTHRLTFSMHHGGALLRPCFRSFPCCFQRKARPRIDCTRTVSDMPPAAQTVRTGTAVYYSWNYNPHTAFHNTGLIVSCWRNATLI